MALLILVLLIAAGLAMWILTAVIAAWPAGLGHG